MGHRKTQTHTHRKQREGEKERERETGFLTDVIKASQPKIGARVSVFLQVLMPALGKKQVQHLRKTAQIIFKGDHEGTRMGLDTHTVYPQK